jgi:DNA-binding GntR family transcriptional regulator
MVKASHVFKAPPLSRVSAPLRIQVSDFIRKAILESEFKPGQRLIERELMERLQVSRATIRESMRELVTEGLVSMVPHRGAIVAEFSYAESQDLYDARIAIEALIVGRFIDKASNVEIELLEDALADLHLAIKKKRPISEVLSLKDEFYDILVTGAESSVLSNLLSSLKSRASRLRVITLAAPGRGAETVKELDEIVQAIAGRNKQKAQKLSALHLKKAANIALKALESEISK